MPRDDAALRRRGVIRRRDLRCAVADLGTVRDCHPILAMIFSISSRSNARNVVVRTLPRMPTVSCIAVAVSSSGASKMATMSYGPLVQ
jgi:hypothetical protein